MPTSAQRPDMPTTQWSLIARLKDTDADKAHAALNEICQAYHYPLYCQIRRRGLTHHDAEDVLHQFMLKLFRLDTFGLADSEKGRLRTYLLVALRRFLATWHRDTKREKGCEISQEAIMAIASAESRFEFDEIAHQESPDRLYDRQWTQEIIHQVLHRLQTRYAAKGREQVFVILRPSLIAGGSLAGQGAEELAARLGMRAGTLRTTFHRLLENFQDELRQEISQTVATREMAKQELAELLRIYQGP